MLKFNANVSELKKIMELFPQLVSKVIDDTLKCIKIIPRDGYIEFQGTDLETFVSIKLNNVRYEGDEAFLVDGVILSEIIDSFKEETASFEFENGRLKITSGKAKFNLPSNVSQRFPQIEKLTSEEMQMKRSLFFKMLDVAYCASNDIKALAGLNLKCADSLLRAAASDGYRLAIMGVIVPFKTNFDFIISNKSVKIIQKFISKIDDEQITFRFNYPNFQVESNDAFIQVRTLNEDFPNISKILDTKHILNVSYRAPEFLEALDRVMVITKRDADKVLLDIQPDNIHFYAEGKEVGNIDISIPASLEGEPIKIYFNPKFLYEAIKHITSPNQRLYVSGELTPAKIIGDNVLEQFAIVLPVRS